MSDTEYDDNTMLSLSDLLLLSVEHRLGRIANGTENLTAQVARLADAFGSIAETLSCLTESVEGMDGVERCTIRTHRSTPNILSMTGIE